MTSKRLVSPKLMNSRCKCLSLILRNILLVLLLTALIIPPILVYLLTTQNNNTTDQSQISESLIYRNYCSGISPYSMWTANSTYVMTMIVNTTQCNFSSTPVYFVSFGAKSSHWMMSGQNAIYFPTKQSFQVYTKMAVLIPATTLLIWAGNYSWDINWTGFY